MTASSNSTESDLIADPLVLVSDGIKSIYVNWQGPQLPDDLSGSFSCSGQVVRSVFTGRHESISAIARAEIGNPDSDYAVKFSPMPKGQARLEVTRTTPAAEQAEAQAATTQPIPPQSPRRRERKPRHPTPDGLKTAAQAAAKLGCSIKTLKAHVASGALRCVDIGRGRKRRHIRFADPDLDEFITTQTRKDVPCPSTRTRTVARRISTSTSKCEVIGFTALQKRRTSAKPKK